MVKLTPEQQAEVLRAAPEMFRPAAGAWGRSGSTVVLLSAISVAPRAHPPVRLGKRRAPEVAREPPVIQSRRDGLRPVRVSSVCQKRGRHRARPSKSSLGRV